MLQAIPEPPPMGLMLGSRDLNVSATRRCSITAEQGLGGFGTSLNHPWQLPPTQGTRPIAEPCQRRPGCNKPLTPLQHPAPPSRRKTPGTAEKQSPGAGRRAPGPKGHTHGGAMGEEELPDWLPDDSITTGNQGSEHPRTTEGPWLLLGLPQTPPPGSGRSQLSPLGCLKADSRLREAPLQCSEPRWWRCPCPHPPRDTHSLRIGAVWAERQGERWSEYPQLPHHLLHTAQGPLLICVSKLHH